MGMLRLKRKTDNYWLMKKYRTMKRNKGTGQAVIAFARKLSVIVFHMLKNNQPFDSTKMESKKKYIEMQKAYFMAAKEKK